MALNEVLYSRLVQKFGADNVDIVRPGVPYLPNWTTDPITGRKTRNPDEDGEAYKLSCPFCGDTKGRLYINHFWMQWDADVGRSADDMIRCFNETNCFFTHPENRSRLFKMLFGDCDPSDMPAVASSTEVARPEVVPEPPGKIVSLSDLHPNQPCCYYLRGRGYDIDTLVRWWGVGYVASVKKGHSPDCVNRIYIPMYFDGQFVGYQCRYIGDREWAAECPKYRTMPGMKRSRYFYNADVAVRSRVVVLVEGPSSAWKIGPRALGIWGNTISKTQVDILRTRWDSNCVIAVMLDGSAAQQSDRIVAQLRANCDSKVVQVQTGFRDDPGSLGEEKAWAAIYNACAAKGIDLTEYLRSEREYVPSTMG